MKAYFLVLFFTLISQFVFGQIGEILVTKEVGNVKATYIKKYKYISEDNKIRYSYFLVGTLKNGFNQDMIEPIQLGIADSLDNTAFISQLEKFIERTKLIVDKEGELSYNTAIGGLVIWYNKRKDKFYFIWPATYNKWVVNKSGTFNIDDIKYNRQDMLDLVSLLKKAFTIQF